MKNKKGKLFVYKKFSLKLVKKVFYNQFDKSQKFLGELFSLVKSSPVATRLPFKNTFASIKTLRALLSNSHSLLKKRGKTFGENFVFLSANRSLLTVCKEVKYLLYLYNIIFLVLILLYHPYMAVMVLEC